MSGKGGSKAKTSRTFHKKPFHPYKRFYESTKGIPYENPDTHYCTELWYNSAICEALGRKYNTIRQWEISGRIPDTPFKKNDRRLYCTEQIRILAQEAEKLHLSIGCNQKLFVKFTENVTLRWNRLFKNKIFKLK